MPIQDLDDVGVNRKPFCMGIFIWEGHILALRGGQSKMQQPWGISSCLGAVVGAPMALGVRYLQFSILD